MKIGCHCVLYGTQIASDTDEVLTKLKFAGAEGCEIGQRFFGVDQADRMKASLEKYDLELSGMHCNGMNLVDLIKNPEKAEQAIADVARALDGMENKNIIVTGCVSIEAMNDMPVKDGASEPELHDPELVRLAADRLEAIVGRIKEQYGAQVHYHNHSWEFADQGLIFSALMERCPSMMFALDTGWAAIAGFDPVALIRQNPERFHYVHLRDFNKADLTEERTFREAHNGFIDLGKGDMNYPRLMECLNQIMSADDWAVVEYEFGNFDHLSYLKAVSYLNGVQDALLTGKEG